MLSVTCSWPSWASIHYDSQAQALEEENEKKAAVSARKTAVDGLAAMSADPLTLWQTAVHLVKMYTSAAAVYVANIVDDEQPDYASPEDPEADVETDDEAELAAGRQVMAILHGAHQIEDCCYTASTVWQCSRETASPASDAGVLHLEQYCSALFPG